MQHALLVSVLGLKLPTLPTLPASLLTGGSGADGWGRFGGGGYSASLKACADVLLSPQDASSWRELGTLLHGKGRLDAAALALQKAVDRFSPGTTQRTSRWLRCFVPLVALTWNLTGSTRRLSAVYEGRRYTPSATASTYASQQSK